MSWMKHYGDKFESFKQVILEDSPVIVEIGAHFGEDSVRFTEAFPGCTVFAFEPDPRCISVFKKYVDNDRVHLVEVALSDKDGDSSFYQSFDNKIEDKVPEKYDWISVEDYNNNKLSNSGSSSLKKGYQNKLGEISVPTRRFDTWFSNAGLDKIDLVWIDVQGAEKEVIEGFGEIIQSVKYLWVEYGESQYEGALSREETISFMAEKGMSFVPSHSSPAFSPQGDLLFCNRQNL